MAMLRPMTEKKLTDISADIHDGEVMVDEGKEYEVADKLFSADPNIIFFYYWNDADLSADGFYSYPIDRKDVELWKIYRWK